MSRYILGRRVQIHLSDIWDYIASDNLDAADRVLASLYDAIEALARNPGAGHTRKDLTDLPLLFWPVGSYLILYRRRPEHIEIVAVLHGARDVPSFLKERT